MECRCLLCGTFPPAPESAITMKNVVWGIVVLLIVLHHDIWLWDNTTLVGGFMPLTLLYHAGISVAAGVTWFLATKYAWPAELASVDASQEDEA